METKLEVNEAALMNYWKQGVICKIVEEKPRHKRIKPGMEIGIVFQKMRNISKIQFYAATGATYHNSCVASEIKNHVVPVNPSDAQLISYVVGEEVLFD